MKLQKIAFKRSSIYAVIKQVKGEPRSHSIYFTISLLIGLGISAIQCLSYILSTAGPQGELETIHNIGTVRAGTHSSVELCVANPYFERICLGKPSSSCGCTVAELNKFVLAAGEKTSVAVRILHPNRNRTFRHTVCVPILNGDHAQLRFVIVGSIVTDMEQLPSGEQISQYHAMSKIKEKKPND